MSRHEWTITGYGIETRRLLPSIDKQISFIKKYLPNQYEEMQEDGEDDGVNDMSNMSDYFDFCNVWIKDFEDDWGNIGFPALFAMAIRENDDFDVIYVEQEGYGAVLYQDRSPWEMTEREKNMKAEDMDAIFKKYLDELEIKIDIGEQCVEMFG